MQTASLIIWLAVGWLYVGAAVAAVFLIFGIDRIDEDARGAYTFRPLLVPGILLLWPLVVWLWVMLERGGEPTNYRNRPLRAAHGWVWLILSILIPALFLTALSVRQKSYEGAPAIRLGKPAS